FSPMLRREGRPAACDPYGQRPTTVGRQCGAENLVADTPKALTHELQLISTSRFAHLCRSRPRGSIREQADALPASARGDGAESGTTRITISSFLASCVESITGMRLDWVL